MVRRRAANAETTAGGQAGGTEQASNRGGAARVTRRTYPTSITDGLLIGTALGIKIGGVAIEYVDVARVDIDVLKKMFPHE